MNEEMYHGAHIDIRSEEEKKDDIRFEEVVAGVAPVDWREKPQGEWRHYSIRYQGRSGSCVAQTLAKIAEVLKKERDGVTEPFSATDPYQDRNNRPESGMGTEDAWKLASRGIPTDAVMPSQGMSDEEMDAAKKPVDIELQRHDLRPYSPVYLPVGDIEAVASVIQVTGKPVMVWFWANMDEWNQDVPQIIRPELKIADSTVRHSVTAVDFTMHNGEKSLVIEDSWGVFGNFYGRRLITESFFKVRNFNSVYPLALKTDKLSHTFTTPLQYGMMGNSEVKILQQLLQRDNIFPSNVDCTGNYLAITAKAILDFQVKHNVAPLEELQALKGRTVGPKTRSKLNEIFAN
jgi:hypothetical protein